VSDKIRIVFDGPPGHESGRFVDVEDTNGRSIKIGEWVELPLGRAPFYALEIDDPRTLAQLRSDLARVTQERDEALREVQRKGAREIGLLSRALAAETQSDITQDALTAMRQERDALSAQLTTAVRDARATAAGDIQRAEAERDAALSDLAKMDKEQNELHALLKAVVDFALDEAGFPASAMIGPDAPLRIVRKLHADLTAMRHRAERAEAELTEVVDAVIGAPQNTAVIAAVERRIAAWLLGPDAANLTSVDLTDPVCPRGTTLTIAADAIRAGTWRTP
jgi:hypothetical protein